MTIAITDEMISKAMEAVDRVNNYSRVVWTDMREALVAAQSALDPVPNDVMIIVDRDGDEWNRNPNDSMVWCHEGGMYFRTLGTVIPQHGPITWESKVSGKGQAGA